MSSFIKDVGDVFNPKKLEVESRRHGGRLRSFFDLGITSGVKSLSKSFGTRTALDGTSDDSRSTVLAAERTERDRGGRTRQSGQARRRRRTALSGGDTLKLSQPGILGV